MKVSTNDLPAKRTDGISDLYMKTHSHILATIVSLNCLGQLPEYYSNIKSWPLMVTNGN